MCASLRHFAGSRRLPKSRPISSLATLGGNGVYRVILSMTAPNFARLDIDRPEVSRLLFAMLRARDALIRRSWSHPQEPTGEEWWADVLADPRARRPMQGRRAQAKEYHRLGDEPRETVLIACSKCDWRAALTRCSASWPGTCDR